MKVVPATGHGIQNRSFQNLPVGHDGGILGSRPLDRVDEVGLPGVGFDDRNAKFQGRRLHRTRLQSPAPPLGGIGPGQDGHHLEVLRVAVQKPQGRQGHIRCSRKQ